MVTILFNSRSQQDLNYKDSGQQELMLQRQRLTGGSCSLSENAATPRMSLEAESQGKKHSGFSSAPHPPLGLNILEARALSIWQIQFSLKQSRARKGWGIDLKADTNNWHML